MPTWLILVILLSIALTAGLTWAFQRADRGRSSSGLDQSGGDGRGGGN